jgi:predicted AlkP superfamily pyrophosphatase or phosphodiesterase
MTRRPVALAILLLLASTAASTQRPADRTGIRLVLLVAIDQFRYDYLTRYRHEYQRGLKRLLDEGAVFVDANLEHYPTVTAVGHATMLSGATPSVSGIIGNDWFDRAIGKSTPSVADDTVTVAGGGSGASASPRRLLVSTLGDQMKLASAARRGEPNAPRVIGLSLKDRSAIMSVGRGADAAYWFDVKAGSFVTSTYYANQPPDWVAAFNRKRAADAWAGETWAATFDPAAVLRQLPTEVGRDLYDAVWATPFGNELLLQFAFETLRAERLGQRGVPDLLAVSFSSNDSVGHAHGPGSPHVRDIALRTDQAIGRLLDRVDELVGLQHTVIALTSDHGVAPLPETLSEMSLPGGRLVNKELFAPIEQTLVARFGPGKWVQGNAGSSPYLDYSLIAQAKLDPEEVRKVAAAAATTVPHVARVYTRDQLLRGEVQSDRVGQRVLRGFNAQRSGDLEIILEPFWIRQATGTSHGSPYNYDAHIPLVLRGPRIKAGSYADHVALNDLAPTLAALLDVEPPSGSSGRVLREAIAPALPVAASPSPSRP